MIEYYIITMTEFTNFMMSLLALFIVGIILWATYDWKEQVEEMKKDTFIHTYKKNHK